MVKRHRAPIFFVKTKANFLSKISYCIAIQVSTRGKYLDMRGPAASIDSRGYQSKSFLLNSGARQSSDDSPAADITTTV